MAKQTAEQMAEHTRIIPFGVAAVTADIAAASRAALVAGRPLRLNDAGWDFAEAPDASRLTDRAVALAFLHDEVKRLCDPWAAHQRRFLDAYFAFVAAQVARAVPELAARLARFGDLYRVEDFQFSAWRPLPRAHIPDTGGWVAVDFAFWTGAALVAIDVADGRRTARRLAAGHDRLRAVGVLASAIAPDALAGDLGACLPEALQRFCNGEDLPSSPFKAATLGDIVDLDDRS